MRDELPRLPGAAKAHPLTLYVLHALVFDLFVDRRKWVHPGGLATSLAFAFANVWHLWKPVGPLERVYRQFS